MENIENVGNAALVEIEGLHDERVNGVVLAVHDNKIMLQPVIMQAE